MATHGKAGKLLGLLGVPDKATTKSGIHRYYAALNCAVRCSRVGAVGHTNS